MVRAHCVGPSFGAAVLAVDHARESSERLHYPALAGGNESTRLPLSPCTSVSSLSSTWVLSLGPGYGGACGGDVMASASTPSCDLCYLESPEVCAHDELDAEANNYCFSVRLLSNIGFLCIAFSVASGPVSFPNSGFFVTPLSFNNALRGELPPANTLFRCCIFGECRLYESNMGFRYIAFGVTDG